MKIAPGRPSTIPRVIVRSPFGSSRYRTGKDPELERENAGERGRVGKLGSASALAGAGVVWRVFRVVQGPALSSVGALGRWGAGGEGSESFFPNPCLCSSSTPAEAMIPSRPFGEWSPRVAFKMRGSNYIFL